MAEFLLEILSEEIPARMQGKACDDLRRLVCDELKKAGLSFETAQAHATPRRLALVIDGLPTEQPDVREERKGPRADAPEKAIEGFLKSLGLRRDQVEERETPKGAVLFAVIEKQGRATADVLGEITLAALNSMPWPKSMKWGSGTVRWVRPLQGILALFEGAVVPVEFADVTSGKSTVGHRFHAPDRFDVDDFADYQARLRSAHVLLDATERREIIRGKADELASAEGLAVKVDDGLLSEVAGLVEWPVPLIGRIDDRFMEVPREVLTASMRAHQKYFSLETSSGELAARFIVVANLEAGDGGKNIVAGNERVLRARLADAKFFWDQDRKVSLESRLPALEKVIFHARLGTVAERVARMQDLAAGSISRALPGDDLADKARLAARLAKADLASGMVAEFPELQGLMGRYYALADDLPGDVSEAVAEHYSPLGPNDDCPTAPVSVAVALADKLDLLVGFFAIDEKPTGSKDPFALRRAALGVIRLIMQNELRLSLRGVIGEAIVGYAEALHETVDTVLVADHLIAFIADRLKVHLREEGVRHDHIDAVFALEGEDDLVRLVARVRALGDFVAGDDGANLLTAYKRASNIVRAEEKKDGAGYEGDASADLLDAAEEKSLFVALNAARDDIAKSADAEDFAAAMSALAELRAPVDAFFENVTVNADDADVRRNRLLLLSQIRTALGAVADFSKIEG
jgi:glycyl-tRNA synthetase beta chain